MPRSQSLIIRMMIIGGGEGTMTQESGREGGKGRGKGQLVITMEVND